MEQCQVLAKTHFEAARTTELGLVGEPQLYCGMVDKMPYAQFAHLFHALYRTEKGDTGGLNPFRENFAAGKDNMFDDAAMIMVQEVKERILDHGMGASLILRDMLTILDDIIRERNKPLDFGGGQEEFAKSNSGRLVSRFLMSFIKESEKK